MRSFCGSRVSLILKLIVRNYAAVCVNEFLIDGLSEIKEEY